MFRRINKKNIGFEVSWSTPPATYAILVLLNSLPAVLRAAALQPLQPQTYVLCKRRKGDDLSLRYSRYYSLSLERVDRAAKRQSERILVSWGTYVECRRLTLRKGRLPVSTLLSVLVVHPYYSRGQPSRRSSSGASHVHAQAILETPD